MSRRAAASKLVDISTQKIHDMLFKGINLARTPVWQRRGILILKKNIYEAWIQSKEGHKSGNQKKSNHPGLGTATFQFQGRGKVDW